VSNDIGQEKNGLENGMKQASIEDESMWFFFLFSP
jgi:hypothetical protein